MLAALALIPAAGTCAGTYPDRPIRFIVPGGAVDTVGRIASFQAKTLQELISMARASPGKINYASGDIGHLTHLAGALFEERGAVKLTHVP